MNSHYLQIVELGVSKDLTLVIKPYRDKSLFEGLNLHLSSTHKCRSYSTMYIKSIFPKPYLFSQSASEEPGTGLRLCHNRRL